MQNEIFSTFSPIDADLLLDDPSLPVRVDDALIALRDECLVDFQDSFIDVVAEISGATPEQIRGSLSPEDLELVEGVHFIDAVADLTLDRRLRMNEAEEAFTAETGLPWSAVRYFSYEEAADDATVPVLDTLGVAADGLAEFLFGAQDPDTQTACAGFLDAGQVPPYGADLSDEHHATCWRVDHVEALAASGLVTDGLTAGTAGPRRGRPPSRSGPPRAAADPAAPVGSDRLLIVTRSFDPAIRSRQVRDRRSRAPPVADLTTGVTWSGEPHPVVGPLGGPRRQSSRARAWGISWGPRAVAMAGFAGYALLAPPGPSGPDSGELAAAGFRLGSPAATGYPLACMLAKLASLLPVGEIALRVHLLGAACAAAAMLWTARLVAAVGAGRGQEPGGAAVASGMAAALLLGVALGFARHAAVTDAAAPVAALLAATLLLFDRVARGGDARFGLLLALVVGLGWARMPVTACSSPLPLLALLWIRLRRGARWPLVAPLVTWRPPPRCFSICRCGRRPAASRRWTAATRATSRRWPGTSRRRCPSPQRSRSDRIDCPRSRPPPIAPSAPPPPWPTRSARSVCSPRWPARSRFCSSGARAGS